MSEVRCVVDAHAEIGESAVWDDRFHLLYWLDIAGRKLHRFDPSTGHDAVWDMPAEAGAVALRAAGGVVLAMLHAFHTFDFMDPTPRLVAKIDGEPATNRLNDGRADPAGRFWSGTVNQAKREPTGAMYCLGVDGKVEKKFGGIDISNSLCWSPDGKTMYHADSFTWKIQAWDFDADTGAVANPRTFIDIPRDEGFSDGATVDAEGCLWAAHWGHGRVKRYDPAGTLMHTIQLPVTNITCPCFGGPNLTTLYVTSATFRLSDKQRAQQPQAGGLFAIETEFTGLPENRYAG
ncbi:MAG TPA: SMP-30/gluconolactonase/LRE family protein [Stellaceae bacterium]|jgi:sugar lactone lactonase YvrE|nr:SMP-30/gluconolactonase/LRE family protein [Stellaceae bacterium]